MKWLIIGTSGISQAFFVTLRASGEEVTSIIGSSKEKAEIFAKKNNISSINGEFDCVYIATPNNTHYEYAKKYILENKHVLIEKPMTDSLKKTSELFELGKKHNVRVMEAYAHITWPEVKEIKTSYIKSNCMNKHWRLNDKSFNTFPVFSKKSFGGALADTGVYPISLTIAILGKVKDIEVINHSKINDVDGEVFLKLKHEKGTSDINISLIKDGDKNTYINDDLIIEQTNYSHKGKDRMLPELKLFLSNDDLSWIQNISLETARVVENIHKSIGYNN